MVDVKGKIGVPGQAFVTEEGVAVSLTADGFVNLAIPKEKLEKVIADSIISSGVGGKVHPDCDYNLPPCKRLAGVNFNDRELTELIASNILDAKLIKAAIIARS